MSDDEKKFTQADVDRIVQERIAREREKFADHDALKAENVELKAKLAANESANLETLKAKIATTLKLPPSLAGRLQGTNEAELKADGEKLLKEIGPREPVGGAGNPPGEAKKPLTREAVEAMSQQQIIANMDQIKSQMREGSLK